MNEGNDFKLRILVIGVIVFFGFVILIGKLWYEQIHFNRRYSESISRQSVRRIRVPALRGRILASDYSVLAENAPSFDLVFYLNEMRRPGRRRTIGHIREAAEAFAAALERPDNLTAEKIARHIKVTPGLPLAVFDDLTAPELARAFQLMRRYPGAGIQTNPVRRYPRGGLASGVLGFVRKDDALKADDRTEFFYYIADLTGKSGAERAFESMAGAARLRGLRGEPGYALIQVDNLGFMRTRALEELEPVNGNNVVLTLDCEAQAIAESLLKDQVGALTLLDAGTGEVLALASEPGVDLGKVSPVWSEEYYRRLTTDARRPLLMRAVSGSYTPGSICKVLVALAALKAGIDPLEKLECDGFTPIGKGRIACANRAGHGQVNMYEAIEKSCNDYFIQIGLRLGMEKLAAEYAAAGIGQPTGLELGGTTGLLPSREYLQNSARKAWTSYDTALIAIGQGSILLSPLQAARFAAALANGGRLPKLRLLKEVIGSDGKPVYRTAPEFSGDLEVEPAQLDVVRQGMFQVVNSPTGSGKNAFTRAVTLYGKTGTAEVDTREGRIKNTWFIAFCTYKQRQYALSLLIEAGQSGGRSCAPLAAEFFERYIATLERRTPAPTGAVDGLE